MRDKQPRGAVVRLTIWLLLWIVDATFTMFLLGVAHSTDARVPALGWITCFLLVGIFVGLVASGVQRVTDER